MSRSLDDLLPQVRDKAQVFLDGCKAYNIPIQITCTTRTYAEQDALYAQGRTKPGKIVTKAKGGESWHNFGRAFDVVPMKDGEAWWDAPVTAWKMIGAIGRRAGLEWGGDWRFKDMPHFQLTEGLTLAQARANTVLEQAPKAEAAKA